MFLSEKEIHNKMYVEFIFHEWQIDYGQWKRNGTWCWKRIGQMRWLKRKTERKDGQEQENNDTEGMEVKYQPLIGFILFL